MYLIDFLFEKASPPSHYLFLSMFCDLDEEKKNKL